MNWCPMKICSVNRRVVGLAATCDCGTPWTSFLLFYIPVNDWKMCDHRATVNIVEGN